jgi:hypothetical protein
MVSVVFSPRSVLLCLFNNLLGAVDEQAKKIDELKNEESDIESQLSEEMGKLKEIDARLEELRAKREAKRKEFVAAEEEVMKAKHNLSEAEKVGLLRLLPSFWAILSARLYSGLECCREECHPAGANRAAGKSEAPYPPPRVQD